MTQTLSFEEYTALDGLGLAELIERGEVSRTEVFDVARALAERLDPKLNAFVEVFERPLDANPDGPFAGVPFVIKDLLCHADGILNENGSRLCVGVRATHDTALMSKYREAGLATLGRVATPEFGYCATTEPLLTGPVRNPWDPTRMPGGSSGASAAVVAAGIAPLAHANDGGGSIRIPAACNGLVGLKPSRGRVSVGPDIGEALNGIAIEFAVTRTVRDCAALLDAVSGPSPGDPYVIAPPSRPYRETIAGRVPRLKIALMTRAWSGCPIEPVMIEGAETTARICQALGHHVVEAAPPLDSEQFMEATHCYWTANLHHWIKQFVDATGRKPGPDTLEATTLACFEAGGRVTASDLLHAMSVANRVTREFAAFFTDYDILLTPTVASPALPLGTINASDAALSAREWTEIQFTFAPFTPQFNMTGQPAISLPLHRMETDLPVGVQFVGRYGAEDTLLMLAAELEAARPWPTVAPMS